MTYVNAHINNEYEMIYPTLGLSQASIDLNYKYDELYHHYTEPMSREEGNPTVKFYSLAQEWLHDLPLISSVFEIALHPAYQQIIGMGNPAIPYILNELKAKQGHWYWALASITGANPILPEDRGNMKKMRLSWLHWGENNGYL